MPRFGQLKTSLSPWRPGSAHTEFVVDKWHWDRFFSEFFDIPPSISFHCASPYSYTIRGINNRPAGGHNSETQSHTINMKDINNYTALCSVIC
jgi:hypothetical protein